MTLKVFVIIYIRMDQCLSFRSAAYGPVYYHSDQRMDQCVIIQTSSVWTSVLSFRPAAYGPVYYHSDQQRMDQCIIIQISCVLLSKGHCLLARGDL